MAALKTFDYFFDLPGELREQILGYLLIDPNGIIIGEPGSWSHNIHADRHREGSVTYVSDLSDEYDEEEDDGDDDDDSQSSPPAWPINYFLVSQTFHREATAVFFHDNTFFLLATGHKRLSPRSSSSHRLGYRDAARPYRRWPGGVFPGIGEALLGSERYLGARRRMRHVVVYISGLRGALVDGVLAPLGDMVLSGGLRSLEVRVWWFRAKGGGMLESAPMRALYRVLRDPDLDVARLRVMEGRHGEVWCQFHQHHNNNNSNNNNRASLPDSPVVAVAVCQGARNARLSGEEERRYLERVQWIDVDLESLVRKHGKMEDALWIFKVGN